MRHHYLHSLQVLATRGSCLIFLALLPLCALAQQAVKPSLPTTVPSREQLFSDINFWQDSLASLQSVAQDTARLEDALDSLK